MICEQNTVTLHQAGKLTNTDACKIAEQVATSRTATLFYLDLEQTTEATTAGLARLVRLRQNLLKTGKDLRLVGLHGQPHGLYEICGMLNVLPEEGRQVRWTGSVEERERDKFLI